MGRKRGNWWTRCERSERVRWRRGCLRRAPNASPSPLPASLPEMTKVGSDHDFPRISLPVGAYPCSVCISWSKASQQEPIRGGGTRIIIGRSQVRVLPGQRSSDGRRGLFWVSPSAPLEGQIVRRASVLWRSVGRFGLPWGLYPHGNNDDANNRGSAAMGSAPSARSGGLVSQCQDELGLRGRTDGSPSVLSSRKAHPLHAPDARRVAG